MHAITLTFTEPLKHRKQCKLKKKNSNTEGEKKNFCTQISNNDNNKSVHP